MRKIFQIFTMLLAVSFFASAFAMDATNVQSQVQDFMQALDAKVKLTPEQKTSMEKIMTDSMTAREGVIKSHQGQKGMMVKKQIRDELEKVNGTTQSEVKKVLDEQQYQAFLDVQTARQEQLRARINSEF